ncbi:MlaD family protein [Sediminicoccus sp. KRV36]|uniref:MlaD family protein n=1 Tax=Sediminicoccus sp. KRV36 TaxID=3133721 RepID=UPI00200E3E9F|nr:MlaD family protein [Sediminicoccus rosea]UPY39097.1 MlaD family protein [Sediminicoccus rosea]
MSDRPPSPLPPPAEALPPVERALGGRISWRSRLAGDEWVGLIVLIALVLFLGAVLQAGVLREWLQPSARLRVLLPDEGISGLAVGAELEVLGTRAGTVRRIVINPASRLYAEVQLDEQAKPFIRRDSVATIRKRFGVAGAAFLDVARGTGAPLDWNYAVIEANSERAPTETVGAIIDDVRGRILPIMEDLGRAAHSLALATGRIERGEGLIGRLLSDDTMGGQLEAVVTEARAVMEAFRRIVASVETVAADGARITGSLSGPQGIPVLLRRADAAMTDLQRVTRDLARASPRVSNIARGVEESVANLPALLLQAQATTRELEAMIAQLRALWLLGGGGPLPERDRVPAERIRP